jgi:hypothetical protein
MFLSKPSLHLYSEEGKEGTTGGGSQAHGCFVNCAVQCLCVCDCRRPPSTAVFGCYSIVYSIDFGRKEKLEPKPSWLNRRWFWLNDASYVVNFLFVHTFFYLFIEPVTWSVELKKYIILQNCLKDNSNCCWTDWFYKPLLNWYFGT